MEPLWGRLGELRMPVTLVVGERDAKFRAIAERMAPAIADSRIELVAGVGTRDAARAAGGGGGGHSRRHFFPPQRWRGLKTS